MIGHNKVNACCSIAREVHLQADKGVSHQKHLQEVHQECILNKLFLIKLIRRCLLKICSMDNTMFLMANERHERVTRQTARELNLTKRPKCRLDEEKLFHCSMY